MASMARVISLEFTCNIFVSTSEGVRKALWVDSPVSFYLQETRPIHRKGEVQLDLVHRHAKVYDDTTWE